MSEFMKDFKSRGALGYSCKVSNFRFCRNSIFVKKETSLPANVNSLAALRILDFVGIFP
jgi:hypothetical protein